MRRRLITCLLGSAALSCFGLAWGQAYPTRSIRLVVPFVPGGTIDAYARVLSRQVESQIGQSIVIDNRGGANGILGADIVEAAPDGYTL
jgi:tripartite-type tricarboxylate transporter receptor subunit TctC